MKGDVCMFKILLGIIIGAYGSYKLSDVVRRRWLLAAATYRYMTESEKLFYAYLNQRIYQMYLNGDLKKLIENAQKAEDCLEPPEEFINRIEADIYARMANNNGNTDLEPRNITPPTIA